MRTTITLADDVAARLESFQRRHSLSLREALDVLLRRALEPPERFETPTFDLGGARVDLTRALELADRLEDEELAHELELRK